MLVTKRRIGAAESLWQGYPCSWAGIFLLLAPLPDTLLVVRLLLLYAYLRGCLNPIELSSDVVMRFAAVDAIPGHCCADLALLPCGAVVLCCFVILWVVSLWVAL